MTCNPLHTQMLQGIASKRSYPYAQPERKLPEKKGSKKPSRSTKQSTRQRAIRTKGD